MLLTTALYAVPADTLRTRSYTVQVNDTMRYEIKLALDEHNVPQYYYRNIFTPVCLTGECKPVYINFYWDLLGNYQRFDFPEGEILTKMDHKPFKPSDYEKLQGILVNTSSIFGELLITDLISPGTENLADSADGKTGATPKKLKTEVIEGAVYTCFTLWHLANGPVKGEMEKITAGYKSDVLLHRFLSSNNHHYQYWAMDRVIDKQGHIAKGYEADIKNIISGANLFTARYALQKASARFFGTDSMQTWLWKSYLSANYPLQVAILKKMAAVKMNAALAENVAANLNASNNEQFKLMLAALAAQQQLPEKTQLRLAAYLSDDATSDTDAVYRTLKQFKLSNNVKNKLQLYETQHPQNEL